jgi:restriction system protein
VTAKAWVIRAGKHGERDQWAVENGYSGGGWKEVPDLTACQTREDVLGVVRATWPGAADGFVNNFTGQLWALRSRIKPGDLLVLPLKTTKKLAIGRVTSDYLYRAEEPEPDKRHVLRVDWLTSDLPRTAVKQDLLFTLGSAMSIFAPTKNNAIARLEHLLEHGTDPGALAPGSVSTTTDPSEGGDVDAPELSADIEQVALDQITTRIAEDFAGHALAALVSAILTAEGFHCVVSPPGPDGGVDIMAGRGPIGLDSPRLLVQVKSGGQIGAPVVTQLQGVMTTFGADQGLLVAWGGLTKPARDALRNQHLRVRVWEAADVADAVLRTYDRLSEEVRAQLPLRRVWMLADGAT